MRSESFCGMSGTVRRGSTSTTIYARLIMQSKNSKWSAWPEIGSFVPFCQRWLQTVPLKARAARALFLSIHVPLPIGPDKNAHKIGVHELIDIDRGDHVIT